LNKATLTIMNRKIKDALIVSGISLATILLVGGCGRLRYKLWRGKYPAAPTWHFFIPEGK